MDIKRRQKQDIDREIDMCINKGGAISMSIYGENLTSVSILGTRELRNTISEVIDSVTNDYKVVISGNVKKSSSKTAAIISTQILKDIMSIYRFNPIINFDEETNQYEVILEEINIYGCGDTKEDAIEMVIDMVIDVTEDYFENSELNARIPTEKAKYPYLLRIMNCSDRTEVKEVLGLIW